MPADLFIYCLVGGALGLAGGLTFIYVKPWSDWLTAYSTPFAAGILLTVTFLGILPEAVHAAGEGVFATVLVTFVFSYLFEHLIFDIHHHEHHSHHVHRESVFLVTVGDTIHNTVDGIAIAAAYIIAPGLGLATAVSSLLHEIPHEIGDFGILLQAGWSKRNIILVNIISAFFTVIGALTIYRLNVSGSVVGQALGVSAGIFLYLAASDFLPDIAQSGRKHIYGIGSLIAGVLVMAAVLVIIPHSHENNRENEPVDYMGSGLPAEKPVY